MSVRVAADRRRCGAKISENGRERPCTWSSTSTSRPSLTLLEPAHSAHKAANVLVVLSDSDRLDLKDGKVFETGFYRAIG